MSYMIGKELNVNNGHTDFEAFSGCIVTWKDRHDEVGGDLFVYRGNVLLTCSQWCCEAV